MRRLAYAIFVLTVISNPAAASDSLATQAKLAVTRVMIIFTDCSLQVQEWQAAYRLNATHDRLEELSKKLTICETDAPAKAKARMADLRKAIGTAGKSDAALKEFYLAFNAALGKLRFDATRSELTKIEEALRAKGDRMAAELEW